jgi:hypothetical protein
MTDAKKVHIAVINSFNVITKRATVSKILSSDVPVFAHDVLNGLDRRSMNLIIKHLEKVEMFEKCAELKKIRVPAPKKVSQIYDDICECSFPDIRIYSKKTKCETCKKQVY